MSMVGLFDAKWFNESLELTAEEDAVMESVMVEECACDDPEDGFMLATLENEQNYFNLMNAIAMNEMQEYIRTGSEIVYEEGQVTKVMNSIKAWIKKAWEKVKSVFQKVVTTISGWVKTDKKFVEKHGSTIKKYKPKDFKFSGYQIKGLSDNLHSNLIASFADEYKWADNWGQSGSLGLGDKLNMGKGENETHIKNMRKAVVSGATTDEEFENGLKKHFGIDTKVNITTYDGAKIVDELSKAKATRAAADKAYKDSKAFFAYMIKLAENVEKSIKSTQKKDNAKTSMKPVSKWNEGCRAAIAMSTRINKVQVKAINIMRSQNRAMANYAIRGVKNEGAGLFDDFEESAMLNFDLV